MAKTKQTLKMPIPLGSILERLSGEKDTWVVMNRACIVHLPEGDLAFELTGFQPIPVAPSSKVTVLYELHEVGGSDEMVRCHNTISEFFVLSGTDS